MIAINTDAILHFLLRLALAGLVFVVVWMLRSAVTWLLARPLETLARRAGRADLQETIRGILNDPARYLILAFGIDVAARILEANVYMMAFIHNITRTLVIIAFAIMIYRLVNAMVYSRSRLFTLTGLIVDEALLPFVRTGIQLVTIAIALVIIIQLWGYNVSGLIAGLGLGGLALSLAAQDTLSNIFAFTAVVGDRPFVVGEFIKTKDVEGVIEKVGLRSTRIRQNNQAVVTVPNSMLASTAILNWSRLAKRQIDMTIGISYEADADSVAALLDDIRAMLHAREAVEKSSVVVFLVNFGSSSLEVLVRCYLTIADWKEFTAEKEKILIEILRLVNQRGLQIAFPRSALYVGNLRSELNLTEQPLASTERMEFPARGGEGNQKG